jgi:hypothetical protein
MRSFLPKCFLSLCCLVLVVSGLAAQSPDAPPDPRNLPPVVLYPDISKLELIQTPSVQDLEKQRREQNEMFGWIRAIALGLVAVLGGWRTGQAVWKAPATNQSQPRIEELGLGADGKGGVWRRQVQPWQS